MTSTSKDATVKSRPRFQGLVKTGSYDALKYKSDCDKKHEDVSEEVTLAKKKKKNPRVRGIST